PVDWLLGGFYQQDKGRYRFLIDAFDPISVRDVGTLENYFNPRSDDEKAGFADITFHVSDAFRIQICGRDTFDSLTLAPQVASGAYFLTPSISPGQHSHSNTFTYLFAPQLNLFRDVMVYGRLASGYRPGAPNTLASIAAGAPAAYKPDKTQNYELGRKGDFLDHRLSADLSLYYNKWQDLQIAVVPPNDKIDNYFGNGGSAKSQGVELSLGVRPIEGLIVTGWISYDDAALTEAFPAAAT